MHVLISDLRNDVYYARVVIEVDGKQIEIDSRSSDAIALAVRASAPIFVADTVMSKAAIEPDEDVEDEVVALEGNLGNDEPTGEQVDEKTLSAFADFVNQLDIDLEEDDDDN